MGLGVGVTLLLQTVVHAGIWVGAWWAWGLIGASTAAWLSLIWHTVSNHVADAVIKLTRIGLLSRRGAVIVTGAGRGLGKAAVISLIRDGYHVIATMRDLKQADDLAKHVSTPERFHAVAMDVASDESVRAGSDKIKNLLNQASLSLVGLINNAGILVHGPVELVPLAEYDRQYNVNVDGTVRCLQAFLPLLRESASASLSPRIVNVSSVLGFGSHPQFGSYCCSKFAVEGLSDALRREISSQGVGVAIIEPGSIQSDMSSALVTGSAIAEALGFIHGAGPDKSSLYEKEAVSFLTAMNAISRLVCPASVFGDLCSHIITVRSADLHTRYLVGLGTYVINWFQRALPDSLQDQNDKNLHILAKFVSFLAPASASQPTNDSNKNKRQ